MPQFMVQGTVYGFPQSVPDIVSKINDDIAAKGWSVDSFGIGNTDATFPSDVFAHWIVSKPDGTEPQAKQAVIDAANSETGYLHSWKDFSSAFVGQVVEPTLSDLGKDAADAVPKIEFGIGFGIVVILVVATAYLVWKSDSL